METTEIRTLDVANVELEQEIDRLGKETGTWRGLLVGDDVLAFGGSIGFTLDSGYSIDSIRGRISGFVEDFVDACKEGALDRGGRPLFENLPDFGQNNRLEIVIQVKAYDQE